MSPDERLAQSLAQLGLPLSDAIRASLLKYLEILLRENEKINLTAIKTLEDGIGKHLVDSLSGLLLLKERQGRWMDLGSGGGMPGLAFALALPEIQMTLVESTKKKAHFLEMASAELGLLKRVEVKAERAETLGRSSLREKADVLLCRAVGRLNVVLELASPLLKVGGHLLIYKGPKVDEEIAEAAKAFKALKLQLLEQKDFALPFSEERRSLLLIGKNEATPKAYPRLPGTPAKEPL